MSVGTTQPPPVGAATPPPPVPARERRFWLPLLFAVVALTALVRLPSFTHQLYDPDEAAIATEAITVNAGGTLYVDAADRKPPLPPLLYAGSFRLTDSTDLRPLHALAAVGLTGAALVAAAEARRRAGRHAAWWAAGLFVCGSVAFFPVDGQAANYAHLALLPATVAIVAARRGRLGTAALAGVSLGLAVLCRQTWAIGLLPAAVAVWCSTPGPRRRRVAALAALASTAFGTVLGLVALCAPVGGFWHWVFAANGGFLTSIASPLAALGRGAASVAVFTAWHLTLVGLLVVAVLRRRRASERTASSTLGSADLWLWLLTGLLAVAAGFRFFGHYWQQVLPPAVLLAAPVTARLTNRARRLAAAGVAIPTVIAVSFAFTPTTFRQLPDPQPVASYVRTHTSAEQPVFVWGNFPEIYWLSDRVPAGALVTDDFVTGLSGAHHPGPATLKDATPGAYQQLLDQLSRHPPALIVDTSTRDHRYRPYPISSFPELDEWLRARYAPVACVGGDRIWAPSATAAEAPTNDCPPTPR